MQRAAMISAFLLGGVVAVLVVWQPWDKNRVRVPGTDGYKTSATARAERRLFDGAPPTIPHDPMGAACTSCHNEQGLSVPDLGYAPPSPHELTDGMSAMSRCTQCHVYATTDDVFVATEYVGFRQDLRKGRRLHALAPPVIPHQVQMRENCLACHSGPAAREEIRTTHPERKRCSQCHVPAHIGAEFERDGAVDYPR